MKKISFLALSILILASCGNTNNSSVVSSSSESSSSSNVNTSSSSTSSLVSSSSQEETLTNDKVKDWLNNTNFIGYSFKDKSNNINGTSMFLENEILIQGKGDFEEEGESDILIYKGIKDNIFYDIESGISRYAHKYNIVEKVESSKIEKTLDECKSLLIDETYNSSWFMQDLLTMFNDETKLKMNNQNVTISTYIGGYKTGLAELKFDKNDKLLSGNFVITDWGKDNFDEINKIPYDEDQTPVSSKSKEFELIFNDNNIKDLNFDITPYYVSSIEEITLESLAQDKTFKAGDYINYNVNKFSPSTALNVSDIKPVSSSDSNIIEINELGSIYAKKEGHATIYFEDYFKSVSFQVDVDIVLPHLTSIWLSYKGNIYVNDEVDVTVAAYPLNSQDKLIYSSSNENVLQVLSLSSDRSKLKVKGISVGEATITVKSAIDENVSKSLTLTVKEKPTIVDSSFLIGTWKNKRTSSSTTLIFNNDGSGTISQLIDDEVNNNASFTWSYDGAQLTFLTWSSGEGYYNDCQIDKPKEVIISEDKLTLKLALTFDDYDGITSTTLTFNKA